MNPTSSFISPSQSKLSSIWNISRKPNGIQVHDHLLAARDPLSLVLDHCRGLRLLDSAAVRPEDTAMPAVPEVGLQPAGHLLHPAEGCRGQRSEVRLRRLQQRRSPQDVQHHAGRRPEARQGLPGQRRRLDLQDPPRSVQHPLHAYPHQELS